MVARPYRFGRATIWRNMAQEAAVALPICLSRSTISSAVAASGALSRCKEERQSTWACRQQLLLYRFRACLKSPHGQRPLFESDSRRSALSPPTAQFAPLPTFAAAAHRPGTELPFLRKDFQRLLPESLHRADIGNGAVADARDTELGQALSRRHAVHNHHIDGQRYAIADSAD